MVKVSKRMKRAKMDLAMMETGLTMLNLRFKKSKGLSNKMI